MKTYVEQLKEYREENGIKKLNITTSFSMGVGKEATEEELAQAVLRLLVESEGAIPCAAMTL